MSASPPNSSAFGHASFQTPLGAVWFDLSPEKIKEYMLEVNRPQTIRDSMCNDLSFQNVLNMSSMCVDDDDKWEPQTFGLSLKQAMEQNIREEFRLAMLKVVCGRVLWNPAMAYIRNDIERSIDEDLFNANIFLNPEWTLAEKVPQLSQFQLMSSIIRCVRNSSTEFTVHLFKLLHQRSGNLMKVELCFCYTTSFDLFLTLLRQETTLREPGYTLEEGPWLFKIASNGKALGIGWNQLQDETTFLNMIQSLRETQEPVIMIHFRDKAIEQEHEKEKAAEDEDWNNDEDTLEDSDGEPFFSKGRYLDYLAEEMRKGEQEEIQGRIMRGKTVDVATEFSASSTVDHLRQGISQTQSHTLLPRTITELHLQLTFKTSSTKKRKLCKDTTTGFDSNPEVPLESIEDHDVPQYSPDLPRFDISGTDDNQPSLPPHLPSHLQNETSLSASDYISSAASSPSAAYAGLSIESERGGDISGSEGGAGLGNTESQEVRSQSPSRSFAHRAIMGGAADFPQRSSSPLKRPASDLEQEVLTKPEEDVDMVAVPSSNSVETSRMSASPEHTRRSFSASTGVQELTIEPKKSMHEGTESALDEKRPSIDEQIKLVMKILEVHAAKPLEPGENAYVISQQWLSRVQARGTGAKVSNKEDLDEDIGPVDNSDVFQEIIIDGDGTQFVRLKPDLARHTFHYFPEEAWNNVVNWYGLKAGQLPILRRAVNTNPDANGIPNVEYELHPPVFVVHRLWSANSPNPLPQLLKAQNPKAPIYVVSRGDSYMAFLKKMKRATNIELNRKVQVWKLRRKFGSGQSIAASIANETSPPPSRGHTPVPESLNEPRENFTHMLLDVTPFLGLERGTQRELISVPDQTNNENYNGHMTVQMADLGVDQALVLDEFVETDYISRYVPKLTNNVPATVTRSGVAQAKSTTNSGRNSPAPSGPMTRGRAQKSSRTIGTVGLGNLGNTCYMNSALQCVRSVEELTKYFLTNQAEKEINRDNPLGNNGEVAVAYGALLEEIYKDPPPGSVVPRYFKNTIGRYAPSFSGYGQQDSQEFLGFLLDGLQEDLSRVKKKPYIEKPDSTDEMVGNPVAIREMAAKVWDITKKRDDSVIADLFTGMYKSTLVCPVCAKVSITFDPFNNLTLQLPIENTWSHDVFYFPLNDRPIKISIDMDKQGSIKALKEFISARVDVPVSRLFIAEEFKYRFYKFYDDMKPVSEEIQSNDQVAVYELESVPTNWPPGKKPQKQKVKSMLSFSTFNDSDEDDVPNWDDPMSERMLVPVLHRHPNVENSRYHRKPWQHAPLPHFIIVTAAEARSQDAIRRKILEKIATFTTHPGFEDDDNDEDESASDNIDSDVVLANASDADSSGDSKVMAASVDGDDELVDVTMKDPNGVRVSIEPADAPVVKTCRNPPTHNTRKRKSPSRRPKWVDPKEYLRPELQNMFELSYFSGTKELVPVGWNTVDEDKEYPKLFTRDQQMLRSTEADDEGETDHLMTNGTSRSEASSDVDDEDTPQLIAPTRMNEESSDEDELASAGNNTRALPVRPVAQRAGVRVGLTKRRNLRMKTYSKKGVKFASLQQRSDDLEDPPDNGPLVRLGEGIVVDWDADAHDAMYEGTDGDTMRGRSTFSYVETMNDPELEAKRKARQHRKKRGLTLDECLDEFGKEEILSEMDTWYCPRCKEHRRASKKFELWKTPDILVMHLKRFSSSAMRRDKLDVFVDFPIEGLDLTSRVVERGEGKEEVYDLFAVDDHWGGLGGGHYTAFAKSFIDGKWYEYNDSSVSEQKDTSRIVSTSAYLLFYRRRSSVPLGGPRFTEIIDRYNQPPESNDEESDSGEDQRLVADSSLPGSSSALIGAGAVHQQDGSGGVAMTRTLATAGMAHQNQRTINPADLERPPAYREELGDDEVAPLMASDAVMNDGLEMHDAIEDEGVDMGYSNANFVNHTGPLLQPSWNFSNLAALDTGSSTRANPSDRNSEFAIEDDFEDRSDIVQHNSSASEGSLAGRLADFDNAEPDEQEWRTPSPIPDVSEVDQMTILAMHGDLLAQSKVQSFNDGDVGMEVKVPPDVSDDGMEDEAAEIHVEEGEGLKMV